MKHFECPLFAIFFSLWGNNGPNWRKEYDIWYSELEKKWAHVTRSKKSYAQAIRDESVRPPDFSGVRQHSIPSSSGVRESVFSRIDIPDDNPKFLVKDQLVNDNFVHCSKAKSPPARFKFKFKLWL